MTHEALLSFYPSAEDVRAPQPWSFKGDYPGAKTHHGLRVKIALGASTWICSEGSYGGWTHEDAEVQVAACRSLRSL